MLGSSSLPRCSAAPLLCYQNVMNVDYNDNNDGVESICISSPTRNALRCERDKNEQRSHVLNTKCCVEMIRRATQPVSCTYTAYCRRCCCCCFCLSSVYYCTCMSAAWHNFKSRINFWNMMSNSLSLSTVRYHGSSFSADIVVVFGSLFCLLLSWSQTIFWQYNLLLNYISYIY